MVKILFRNARGASGEKFRSAIVDLVKIHNVDILAVCEPRVDSARLVIRY